MQVKAALLDPWTKQKMYALKIFLERLLKACLVDLEGKFYNCFISMALFSSSFTNVTFLWCCFLQVNS